MADEENHRDLLEKYRVEIVSSLDLERQFIFSYLRSNNVFDDDDCERILNGGTSRQQKASKFLDVLACKGKEAVKHFIDALEYDHPTLYETLTGQQAVPPRVKPIPVYSGGQLTLSTRLADKELIDSDRQYLANQLERTTNDLQTMAFMHNKMVREKNLLEQKLLEANGYIEEKQRYVDELKGELQSVSERASEQRQYSAQGGDQCNHYVQELARDSLDKSNAIIILQAKLLSSNDDTEQLRRNNDELRQKNENLMEHVKDLTINYDYQKRQSTRLNERVKLQTDEIKRVEDFRHQLYQIKFQMAQVSEERDVAIRQLKEFRKVTEALNLRYDLVCHQKEQVLEEHETVSVRYGDMQGRFDFLGAKLKDALLESGDWQRKNAKLKEEISTYREQRLGLLQERERAINERNCSLKERDEALRLNQEIQRSRDEAVSKQIEITKKVEKSHKEAQVELEECRCEISRLQSELTETDTALHLLQKKTERSEQDGVDGPTSNTEDAIRLRQGRSSPSFSKADASKQTANATTHKQGPWKKRSDQDILNSARRRLLDLGDAPADRKGFSLPGFTDGQLKNLFNFDQDNMLIPLMSNFRSLQRLPANRMTTTTTTANNKSRKNNTTEQVVVKTTEIETYSEQTSEEFDERYLSSSSSDGKKDEVICGLSRKNAVRVSNKERFANELPLHSLDSHAVDRFRSISLNAVTPASSAAELFNDDSNNDVMESTNGIPDDVRMLSADEILEGYLATTAESINTVYNEQSITSAGAVIDDDDSPSDAAASHPSMSASMELSAAKEESVTKRKLSRLTCSRPDGSMTASPIATPTSPFPTSNFGSLLPGFQEETSTETKL